MADERQPPLRQIPSSGFAAEGDPPPSPAEPAGRLTETLSPEDLPSKGLAYPPGTEIGYRNYVFGDLERINSRALTSVQLYELCADGLEVPFDWRLLTLSDFFWVVLRRKLFSLGSDRFTLKSACPVCGFRNVAHYELADFQFDDVQASALPLSLDFTGGPRTWSPPRIGEWLDVVRGLPDGSRLDRCTVCALALRAGDPEQGTLEELAQWVYGLSDPLDVDVLREAERLCYHGPRYFEFVCQADLNLGVDGEEPRLCRVPYRVNPMGVVGDLVQPFRGDEGERREFVASKIHAG